jgi:hypothetical protein
VPRLDAVGDPERDGSGEESDCVSRYHLLAGMETDHKLLVITERVNV